MPYFIYKISTGNHLECIASLEGYRDARSEVRAMRSELDAQDTTQVRMVFARDAAEAERLLNEKREPRPMGEE